MKKLLYIFILFPLFVLGQTSDDWIEYELPPSKIVRNGQPFFGGKLSDYSRFHVYYDSSIDADARFYHAILRQDFGWKLKDDITWTGPSDARDTKLGYIYISPSREAAVYYYPDREYSVFKVGINY